MRERQYHTAPYYDFGSIDPERAEKFINSINDRVGRHVVPSLHTLGSKSFWLIIQEGIVEKEEDDTNSRLFHRYFKQPVLDDAELANYAGLNAPTSVVDRRRGLLSRIALGLAEKSDVPNDTFKYRQYSILPARLYGMIGGINQILRDRGAKTILPYQYNFDMVDYLIMMLNRYKSASSHLSNEEKRQRLLEFLSARELKEAAMSQERSVRPISLSINLYQEKIAQIIQNRELSIEAADAFGVPIDVSRHDEIIKNINSQADQSVSLPTRMVDYEYLHALLQRPLLDGDDMQKYKELEYYMSGYTSADIGQKDGVVGSGKVVSQRRRMYIRKVADYLKGDISYRLSSESPLELLFPQLSREECVALQFISKKYWKQYCKQMVMQFNGEERHKKILEKVIPIITSFGQESSVTSIIATNGEPVPEIGVRDLCEQVASYIRIAGLGDGIVQYIREIVMFSNITSKR